jgi:hypothetical protein
VNKQYGGYATGQLAALNYFRKRIRPSWQMLPRNCSLTQFAFIVIAKHYLSPNGKELCVKFMGL